MTRPEVDAGVQAASTFKTVAQNYQSGLGCASALIIIPIALIGTRLDLPGWLLVVIILAVLFTSLGSIVYTAYRDAQKAQKEYMEKAAARRENRQ
jgi:hypothetical protein